MSQLYPGGISGVGSETVHNVFSRLTQDTFRLTVIGPDKDTGWNYDVRCRVPKLADNEECSLGNDEDCPSSACAHADFRRMSSNVCCTSGALGIDVSALEGWFSVNSGDGSEVASGDDGKMQWNAHCQGQTKRKCLKDPLCNYERASDACVSTTAQEETSAKLSNRLHYFCRNQPDGSLCGEYDSLCSSNACQEGRCVNSMLERNGEGL